MRKILSLVLGLLWAVPAFADLDPCRNLLDPEWTQNKGTNGSNGNVVDSEGWSITDLIPVEPGQYVWSMSALYQTYTFYYDTNKQFISPHGGPKDTQERQITIPSNAKYVRLQIKAVGDSLSSMQQQLERGDTATAYTPYNPLCATCDGTIVNYVSATGTVSQSGTPTPDNPIEPVFYQQGNMVLRKVGDYADSYDATTGKITRRVGVKVLDGSEEVSLSDGGLNNARFSTSLPALGTEFDNSISTHFGIIVSTSSVANRPIMRFRPDQQSVVYIYMQDINMTLEQFKSWLVQQYAAGTPVTIYYPLETETTEYWPASYCETPIKIATTKYNETKFSPLNTALQNAISVVDTVVSNTITQAGRIATLQAQKQTRPNDIADDSEKCPAGKKCLLVEDASGVPHWYEIVTSRLPDGYTELQYIESTGTQYIKLPSFPNASNINVTADVLQTNGTNEQIFFAIDSVQNLYTSGGSWRTWKSGASDVSLTNPSSRHLFDIKTTRSGVKYYIDGTQNTNVSATFYTSELFSARILFLGARTTNSGADYFWQGRIYSFNSECDGVVCMNLVPALNPDGKIGMYDLVGERFYENAGTGEFIGGQPVFN